MARVFVSYRRVAPDDAVAIRLYRALTDLGHDVFLDSEKISIGDRWPNEIGASLERAEWFVPLISSTYLASENCVDKELVIALARRRRGQLAGILPVYIAFAGAFPERIREVSEIQADKWAGPDDTVAVVERVASLLPRPMSLVKGMRAFDVADGDVFRQLCREREIDECRCLLADSRGTLVIHGVSGSGKTSFVRAGLIARLPPGSWQLVTAGEQVPTPSEALAGGATTLILDQFEQAVVQLADEPAAAAAFERDAAEWLRQQHERRLLIVLRDEYRTPFDAVLPTLAGTAASFPLLPLSPDDAGRALIEILTSAQVEHDAELAKKVVHELVDGVPPRVRPALLQLIAHESFVSGRPFDKRHWGDTPATRRAFFETHVRLSVIDRMPSSMRLSAALALRGLTAGELKTAPRTPALVAKEEHLASDDVVRTLEAAASPDARVVTVHEDAGVETYQLVHDLFAGAIHGIVKAEEQARRGRTRRVVGAVLAGLFAMSVVFAVVAAVLWRTSEKSRADAERTAAALQKVSDERLLEDARAALEIDPARAAALLAAMTDLNRQNGLPIALAQELSARGVPTVLPGSRTPVIGIAMDRTAERLVSFHANAVAGEIHVWDLRLGTHESWSGLDRIESFAATPDVSMAVAGTASGQLILVDVGNKQAVVIDSNKSSSISAVAIARDGKTFAFSAELETPTETQSQASFNIVTCDVASRHCREVPSPRMTLRELHFDSTGTYLAAAGYIGDVFVWRIEGDAARFIGSTEPERLDRDGPAIVFRRRFGFTETSPPRIVVASDGCSLDEITLVDDKPKSRCVSRNISGDVDRLLVDPGGAYAFCASQTRAWRSALSATQAATKLYSDGWATSDPAVEIIVHRVKEETKVTTPSDVRRRQLHLVGGELLPTISADGRRLALADSDGTIRVWPLAPADPPTSVESTRTWLKREVVTTKHHEGHDLQTAKASPQKWPIEAVAPLEYETTDVIAGMEVGMDGAWRAERIGTWPDDGADDTDINRAFVEIDRALDRCLAPIHDDDLATEFSATVSVRERRTEGAKLSASSLPPCVEAAFGGRTFRTVRPSFEVTVTYRLSRTPTSSSGGFGFGAAETGESAPNGSGLGTGVGFGTGTGCPGSRSGYGAGN